MLFRSFPKKNVNSYIHIGAFITAYTRCNLFEKIFNNIPYENIIQIKLDEIIYKCDNETQIIKDDDLFRQKEKKIKIVPTSTKYYDMTKPINCPYYIDYLYDQQYNLLNGMGGSGKTHYCLSNKAFINNMFVAQCWRLIVDKKQQYGVNCRTINRMLGDGTEPYYKTNNSPSVFIIDEGTQLDNDNILKLKDYYPYSMFIILADIDNEGRAYQCLFPNIKLIDINIFGYIKTFEKSYRCKDPKLMELLLNIRDNMCKNYDEYQKFINGKRKTMKDLIFEQSEILCDYCEISDDNEYNINDTILVSNKKGINSQVKYYTNKFKHMQKYIVNSHSFNDVEKRMGGDNSILLNGEITFEDGPRRELCHAYTIHSVQGLTVTGNKLFIDINKIFDYQQIYTAISRVEYLTQIHIICGDVEEEF